jgi:hypothetical protein
LLKRPNQHQHQFREESTVAVEAETFNFERSWWKCALLTFELAPVKVYSGLLVLDGTKSTATTTLRENLKFRLQPLRLQHLTTGVAWNPHPSSFYESDDMSIIFPAPHSYWHHSQ